MRICVIAATIALLAACGGGGGAAGRTLDEIADMPEEERDSVSDEDLLAAVERTYEDEHGCILDVERDELDVDYLVTTHFVMGTSDLLSASDLVEECEWAEGAEPASDEDQAEQRRARERERTAAMDDDQLRSRRDRLARILSGPSTDLLEAVASTSLISSVGDVRYDGGQMVVITAQSQSEAAAEDDRQLREGALRAMQAFVRTVEPEGVTASTFPQVGMTVDVNGNRLVCPPDVLHQVFQLKGSRGGVTVEVTEPCST